MENCKLCGMSIEFCNCKIEDIAICKRLDKIIDLLDKLGNLMMLK